jgi:uncharacterized protein (DUF2141 family)
MKKFSFIFFISLFINVLNTFAQFTLTVEFTNLRNNNGNLLYELFDAKQKSLKVGTVDISNNKCLVVFENLKPAKYGVNFIHDENKNKKLDTKMLMIPKEGFGYSNNPTVKFGPPAYEKWIFEVKENTKITCKTTYLNY